MIAVFGGDLSKRHAAHAHRARCPVFEGVFDVRQLGTNYVLPTLSVRADDQLGLHSEVAEEIVVDNVPPILSLDPPNDGASARLDVGQRLQCSQPFDPVGEDAANDGEDRAADVRAARPHRGPRQQRAGITWCASRSSTTTACSSTAFPPPTARWRWTPTATACVTTSTPMLVPTTNISASNQAVALQLTPIPPGGEPTCGPRRCRRRRLPGAVHRIVGKSRRRPSRALCLGADNLQLAFVVG